MTNSSTGKVAFLLFVVFCTIGATLLAKGGVFIGQHEGDALHLMQIVFRMADGQIPHVDFMTPIGALAFWPIAMFVKAGFGVGAAFVWAQILVSAMFLPLLIWIAHTRLHGWLGGVFGIVVLVLLMALVHGEAERAISVSMHYNRQAWAAAFVAIVMSLIKPVRGAGTVDGIVIGAMICCLALIKMTYFVSFVVPIIVALVLTGQGRALIVGVITGMAVLVALTLLNGVEFWLAYANDLWTVAGSDVRTAPGDTFFGVLIAPAYLGATIAAFAAVIMLRWAGVATGGLVLLLLLPGFFYVTYQNFGNDPQWLLVLAVLVLALRRDAADTVNWWGVPARDGLAISAAVLLAFTAPSFLNLAYSPIRNLSADGADYRPILPRGGVHRDLQGAHLRLDQVNGTVALDETLDGLTAYSGRDDPVEFRGAKLPRCRLDLGLTTVMDAIVRDLEDAGLAQGKTLLAADLLSSHWLFGAFEPLDQGAPWYYGGLPGIDAADYLLVPTCPAVPEVQAQILTAIKDAGLENGLTELRRTDLYTLYALP